MKLMARSGMEEKKILFISNGYGEDMISTSIISSLQRNFPEVKICALPVVGEGQVIKRLGIQILGPQKIMPSEGLFYQSYLDLFRDLKGGLINLILRQIMTLRKERENIKLVIGVGDKVPLLFSYFFIKKPFIFVEVAISGYIGKRLPWEKWLMKKHCRLVFTRDQKAADTLVKADIPAVYVGNPMMDSLKITGENFGIKGNKVIGILPGSRKDAYDNLFFVLGTVRIIASTLLKRISFLLAFPPTLSLAFLEETASRANFKLINSNLEEKKRGIIALLVYPEETKVKVILGRFGDVLNCSQVIIGLAGTGNEQAAGLGKPIVTFWRNNSLRPKEFVLRQKILLGEVLVIVKKDQKAIAEEVLSILNNPLRIQTMSMAGQRRMGKFGAVDKITSSIMKFMKNNN